MVKKKKITSISLFFIILIGLLVLGSNYNKKEKLYNDNNDEAINSNKIAVMLEQEDGTYAKSNTIPTSGYLFNSSKSACSNGAIPSWEDGSLKLNNLSSKNTSCYLYFDIQVLASSTILNDKTISTRTDFSSILTADTTGIIYSVEDDDGTSYYFAGAPTDNWVKFAGFYWRIILINGDGTIRLIYNGTSTSTTGTGTQIGTSAFNTNYDDNAYVGYMYTTGSLRGTGTSSTIKGVLDDWYDSKLASYASYIDTNAGFCGDRTPSTSNSSSNGSGGTGTTTTYYGAYNRRFNTHIPTLKCENSGDLYTLNGASKGNKALTKPIGLITMDEVGYAGADMSAYTNNTSYYLYTGQNYWTMSPNYFNSGDARVFWVYSNGTLRSLNHVNLAIGVRPVINLRADVELTGSGTSSDPYVVEGAE